jgi:hypothetical protein
MLMGQVRLLYGIVSNIILMEVVKILFWIDREGLINETIIVIVSDHGQIGSGYNDTYAINKQN